MKALQPKFLLDRPNQEDYTYIMCCLNYKNVRMKVATGDYILPGHWDKETQRPTTERRIVRNFTPIQNKEMRMITHHLDDLEFFVKDQLVDMRAERDVDLHVLKDRILEFLGRLKQVNVDNTKIIDYAEEMLKRMQSGDLLTSKSTKCSASTIRNFKTMIILLQEFENRTGKLLFKSLDSNFFPSLINFCNIKGYKQNTTASYVKKVRHFLTLTKQEKIAFDYSILESNLPNIVSVDTIALTKDELKAFSTVDIPENLQKARDLFLIGCYTLLRFSDYTNIKPENVRTTENGIVVLDSVNKKTNKRNVIPLVFPDLEPLLKKYDYTTPRMRPNTFGEQIKLIAKLAGITSPVTISETVAGVVKIATASKYELVTTHTARRTGATILYKSGYPLSNIQKLLAHSSEAMTLKYLKVSLDENAELMMDNIIL